MRYQKLFEDLNKTMVERKNQETQITYQEILLQDRGCISNLKDAIVDTHKPFKDVTFSHP